MLRNLAEILVHQRVVVVLVVERWRGDHALGTQFHAHALQGDPPEIRSRRTSARQMSPPTVREPVLSSSRLRLFD